MNGFGITRTLHMLNTFSLKTYIGCCFTCITKRKNNFSILHQVHLKEAQLTQHAKNRKIVKKKKEHQVIYFMVGYNIEVF